MASVKVFFCEKKWGNFMMKKKTSWGKSCAGKKVITLGRSKMNRSQIANKLKGQIREFSGKLSNGLPKVVGRFMEEMLYGILCRQSVRVSEIGRAVNEPRPGRG